MGDDDRIGVISAVSSSKLTERLVICLDHWTEQAKVAGSNPNITALKGYVWFVFCIWIVSSALIPLLEI